MICKHCGEEIEPIDYFYRGRPAAEVKHGWHHVKATDNADGEYVAACECKCADCYQPLGAGPCIEGEEAEPNLPVGEYCDVHQEAVR